jgi:hypothetical protein
MQKEYLMLEIDSMDFFESMDAKFAKFGRTELKI